MGATNFRELIAWKLARELRASLMQLLQKPVFKDDRDFRWQVIRAARSCTANIAEGFSCTHAEFARFLDISGRSLREIEDRLIEAVDEGLLTADEAAPAFQLKKRTATAVARLADYLRRTPDPPTFKPRPRNQRRTPIAACTRDRPNWLTRTRPTCCTRQTRDTCCTLHLRHLPHPPDL